MPRRSIPLVLAMMLAVSAAAAVAPKTEAEADGFLGPVRSVKTVLVRYDGNGKPAGPAVVTREQTYDTLQRRLEVHEGALTVHYDWDGGVLTRMRALYPDDPSRNITTEYMRDASGEVVEIVVTDKNGTRREVEPKTAVAAPAQHDHSAVPPQAIITRAGDAHETLVYGPEGQVERRVVQSWDQASHSWTIRFYNGDRLDKTAVQTFDPESGKQLEMRMYDAAGKPLQIMQRRPDGSYQQAGDIMERGRNWSASDAEGRTTEMFFDDGSTFEWHTMSYDEKGRVSGQTNYNRGHKVILRRLYEYKDDEHGNWVRKVDRECDASACRASAVWMREIAYY